MFIKQKYKDDCGGEGRQRCDCYQSMHMNLVEPTQDLDTRMKAAGMIPLSEILKGSPMDAFLAHAGVVDIDSFGEWLEVRYEEMMRMRVRMELKGSPEEDEMYEWVFSHSAVLREVIVNFRAALRGGGKQ